MDVRGKLGAYIFKNTPNRHGLVLGRLRFITHPKRSSKHCVDLFVHPLCLCLKISRLYCAIFQKLEALRSSSRGEWWGGTRKNITCAVQSLMSTDLILSYSKATHTYMKLKWMNLLNLTPQSISIWSYNDLNISYRNSKVLSDTLTSLFC